MWVLSSCLVCSRHQLTTCIDCLNKLDILSAKGGRGRSLTIGEIEHASVSQLQNTYLSLQNKLIHRSQDAAFYPSVYGESLDRIMSLQSRSYPSLKVPVILPFLADGILALGGLTSEGIFRVPGDADAVSELKSRIDRGHYQLVRDPADRFGFLTTTSADTPLERYRRPARRGLLVQAVAQRARRTGDPNRHVQCRVDGFKVDLGVNGLCVPTAGVQSQSTLICH